ncbi:polysaccharide lyase family 8 super-sandwich domain-containing protein [Streptacidiphilus rugosus]|uniref:polysaccharide lyase family 8 super-sandwich domain-containing protein n=1 Tax=Streptacidiphilus rugosus TaxID=405783 RepID=UPI0007C69F25|nr:polysaccharide lyase family 8 super-sandwich domain-containing protein [Streptacidiphilus rugosus]
MQSRSTTPAAHSDAPVPHPLSRRRFLQLGAAVTALTAGGLLGAAAPAEAADAYDALRARWLQLLTGTGFDPTAAPFAAMLGTIGSQAATDLAAMAPTGGSLWPDLPIGTVSANVTTSYARLRTMALAYVQPGTGQTGSATLASAVSTGLDWMQAHAYTPTTTTYDNWWDWQIGSPEQLEDICVLMYAQLTSAQIANYCSAVDHFVPDSAVAAYSGTSTGANRVDLCHVLALRGVLGRSSAKLTTAQAALSPVFPYVLNGDGLYADGSFIQHTYLPYTGSYGAVLLGGVASLLYLLSGSGWAVTDPGVQNLYDSVARAYAPFLFNGLVMDGVSGRAISRGVQLSDPLRIQQDDHTRGHGLINGILLLADAGVAPAAQTASWKGMVKGWVQRDYYSPMLDDRTAGIPGLARAQTLVNDATVTAAAEPVGAQVFGMDRAVFRRAGWAASVSMASARTTYYETGNGENLRGWHTDEGMLYWWGAGYGNGQYSDAFWPTVDPYRLPGTTVSTVALADGAGGAWGASHPAAVWVGGATDGSYAAVGQDLRGLSSTITGKKSWFFFDDSVMCLGAGISCTDGVPVETVIDNRNLGANGTHALTVDGTAQPTTLGWSNTFTGAQSIVVSGFGGYVFPGGATVHALREARTGAWSDINTGADTTALTRRYLTLWFAHGTDPGSAGYSYLLMPGADAAAAAARAASPQVTVVANTAAVQAVSDGASGVTAANFYAAGSAGPITVSAPASVLMREQSGTLTVAVSDPSRTAATVQVTIARSGYLSAAPGQGVTVLGTSGGVTLLVEVGGAHGASRTVTLTTSGTAPAPGTAVLLAPTADTYVRDGSAYAGVNYGTATTLVVKNTDTSGSGYSRQALLSFDVSQLGGAVGRAVLWLYGQVQDSGGTLTTVQAFASGADTWTETGVTWSSAPALGAALGTGRISSAYDWVGLDVTAAVAAALPGAGGDGKVSLTVFGPLGAAGLAAVFNSRENAADRPVLEVVTHP